MGEPTSKRVQDENRKKLRSYYEKRDGEARRELLIDLANLGDDDCGWFWKKWGPGLRKAGRRGGLSFRRQVANDQELLDLREELRLIWKRRNQSHARATVFSWLNSSTSYSLPPFVVVSVDIGCSPNPLNFRVQLGYGAAELAWKMAVCENPSCDNPYFLKYRDSRQRVCGETNECREFGQREVKKTWWKNNRGANAGGRAI